MAEVNVLNIGDVALPGKNYLPLAAFNIPVLSSLEGCFMFGQGPALAGKNYAPGKPDAAMLGTITDANGYVVMSPNAYLQTEIAETSAMTLIVAAKESSADAVGLIGNYTNGTDIGVSIFVGAGATVISGNAQKTSGTSSVSATSDTTAWGLYGFQVPATGATTMRNLTTGGGNNSANTDARQVSAAGNLRIGRLYSASFSGAARIQLAMIYSRALSLDELNDIAAWARGYASQFGITY